MRSHRLPLLLTFVFAGPLAALELHVATDGNDAWSGRLARPNETRSDGPLASLEGAGGQPPKSSADASPEVAETIKRLQAEVLQERTARILETRRAKYPNAIAALGDDVAAQMDEARLAGLNEQLNATAAPKVDPNNPARRATGPKPISELTDAELRERFRATPVPGRS